MPYPTRPEIEYSYTAFEQSQGNGDFPGHELDVDLANLKHAVDGLNTFVRGVTRSDGRLANGSVGLEQLSSGVRIGLEPPEVWAAAASYALGDTVFFGTRLYLAQRAHTASSSFSTDLAGGLWSLLADFTPPASALTIANNLSDVENAATARANLGLGAVATDNTVAQANGGTGATSLAAASVTPTGGVVDALGDVLAQTADVTAYGADPTGVADSQPAFVAMANATGGVIRVPAGRFRLASQLSRANGDLVLLGAGKGRTTLFFNGATGGVAMTDTTNTANAYKVLHVKDITFETDQTGFTAISGSWRGQPFAFGSQYSVVDVDIRTSNIEAPQSWTRGVKITNGIGGRITGLSMRNQRDVPVGAGVEWAGLCYINYADHCIIEYTANAFMAVPVTLTTLAYNSQTVNFTPGLIVTSSGGATGVIIRQENDAGASGLISVAHYGGTFAPGQTISDAGGGDGTITAVATGLYGGEGTYLSQCEAVGNQRLFFADMSGATSLKPGYGLHFQNVHSNSSVAAIELLNYSQVTIDHCPIYMLATNSVGIKLTDCDWVMIDGNYFIAAAAATGTVGIDVRNSGGAINSFVNVQGNLFDNVVTGVRLESNTQRSRIRNNHFVNVTTGVDSAAALYPNTAGVFIEDNVVNGVADQTERFFGPSIAAYSSGANEVMLQLWNSGRKWQHRVAADGVYTLFDATANAVRFGVDNNGLTTLSANLNGATVVPTNSFRIRIGANQFDVPCRIV